MNNPLPRLPEFEYIRLDSAETTVTFLEKNQGKAYPLLGGTDILVTFRDRKIRPEYLVELKHLDGFNILSFTLETGLTIGAAVTLNQIISYEPVLKHFPVLGEAAKQVGGYQLRNRATLVGNLCNASPCGDTIGPSIIYQGTMNILGPKGTRSLPLSDFFRGPGKTSLQPGEIVRSINFPTPPEQSVGTYLSFGRNKLSDLALVAVTVLAYPDVSTASGLQFRIALSAVSPTVILIPQAQALLSNQQISPSILEEAARIAMDQCRPINDIRASKLYRRELVYTLTLRALHHVWKSFHP